MLERRRSRGLDRHDEVWTGVYVMMPAPGEAHWLVDDQLAELLRPLARQAGLVSSGEFNLGDRDDYVIPDRGLHRPEVRGDWRSTAALVVEILSPGDRTWEKLGFYAARHVEEVVIVDPRERTVSWLALRDDGSYGAADHSSLIDVGVAELSERIDWPE
ncbi:MAG: Uma2 family endonuclease [Solirubrobacteraceae bacterium]|jgi:Uma2 family endonuclease